MGMGMACLPGQGYTVIMRAGSTTRPPSTAASLRLEAFTARACNARGMGPAASLCLIDTSTVTVDRSPAHDARVCRGSSGRSAQAFGQ